MGSRPRRVRPPGPRGSCGAADVPTLFLTSCPKLCCTPAPPAGGPREASGWWGAAPAAGLHACPGLGRPDQRRTGGSPEALGPQTPARPTLGWGPADQLKARILATPTLPESRWADGIAGEDRWRAADPDGNRRRAGAGPDGAARIPRRIRGSRRSRRAPVFVYPGAGGPPRPRSDPPRRAGPMPVRQGLGSRPGGDAGAIPACPPDLPASAPPHRPAAARRARDGRCPPRRRAGRGCAAPFDAVALVPTVALLCSRFSTSASMPLVPISLQRLPRGPGHRPCRISPPIRPGPA